NEIGDQFTQGDLEVLVHLLTIGPLDRTQASADIRERFLARLDRGPNTRVVIEALRNEQHPLATRYVKYLSDALNGIDEHGAAIGQRVTKFDLELLRSLHDDQPQAYSALLSALEV